MAVQKILGQIVPAITTLTTVYAVPALKSATVSSIVVCNRDSVDSTFRISVAINGAADTPAQYLFYDSYLEAKSSYTVTIGITLATGDVIRAYSSNAVTSINIFGIEV